MSATWLLLLLLALSALGFVLGRSRAMASAGGDSRLLHSLPKYYGLNVVMTALAPAMLLLVAWVLIQPMVAQNRAAALIPAGHLCRQRRAQPDDERCAPDRGRS